MYIGTLKRKVLRRHKKSVPVSYLLCRNDHMGEGLERDKRASTDLSLLIIQGLGRRKIKYWVQLTDSALILYTIKPSTKKSVSLFA